MTGNVELIDRLRAMGRSLWRAAAGLALVFAFAITWTFVASEEPMAAPQASAAPSQGWGHEALADVRQRMRSVSIIADANACGMGASSCFKCHNGTRAAAPKQEKWHTDHKTVNDSCVGCHKGNARLIKADLAHANMIKDARTAPDTCTKCHKGNEAAELLKSYKK
ncbi:MAG: hypothetical protein IPI03_00865 [Rubrivivax sp.]|nr:hypothetical protein [Rubrivivax sp.]MBK7260505.1 hypothetical protein [Rubrivivax sp.]MBK8526180.1 hypothetical protein [Rubrivivax sp.]